jgi:hypothetical protein
MAWKVAGCDQLSARSETSSAGMFEGLSSRLGEDRRHLQMMLGLSFANSRQAACRFARRAALSEFSGEPACAGLCVAGAHCCGYATAAGTGAGATAVKTGSEAGVPEPWSWTEPGLEFEQCRRYGTIPAH